MRRHNKISIGLIIALLLSIIITLTIVNGCNTINGMGVDLQRITDPYVKDNN